MKTLILKLILTTGIFVFGFNSFAQNITDSLQIKKVDTLTIKADKKLKFGSGFGLNFVGGTNISISPNLTYTVSKKIAVGVGLQWNYLSIKDLLKTISYGGNVVFQYQPVQKISTLLEFAQLRVSTKSDIDNSEKDYWDSALFVGAGFNVTEQISIGAKYNFLYDEDESIYSSPVIPFVNVSF